MKYTLFALFISLFFSIKTFAQSHVAALSYYLPDIKYRPDIPTPEQYFGFQVGEWHVTHDQLLGYFKALDAVSDRIEIIEYARSHEKRPLVLAVISSKENLNNKEFIKKQHAALDSPDTASDINTNKLPAILWQGYSIHGNEASGSNAAILVAYYLAAGISKDIDDLLTNTVILLDPCLNPDGLQRFSTWVNSHKSMHLVSDPASREFSEVWPGGRYNHYWADMNRDWLLLVHPESQGRVRMVHEWHPNVLTDHHEMGTNATFFFQPGIPSGNNPNTPEMNFILTEEIGKYHARALDSIGSLYYSKANFDDFYYGKGSTYPDAIGSIGILFEQASSRGHLQESVNGPLSFSFAIRNQVVTSLSTQKAIAEMRKKLLDYKKEFKKRALEKIKDNPIKGYLFTDNDEVKLQQFLSILLQHKIEIFGVNQDHTINGQVFPKNRSYLVPLEQSEPILAKTIFEQVKSFQDSSFYDVSGWTLSYAFGLTCQPVNSVSISNNQKVSALPVVQGTYSGSEKEVYAYLAAPQQHYLHKWIYALQQKGVRIKVSYSSIEMMEKGKKLIFEPGTVIIPAQNQIVSPEALHKLIRSEADNYQLDVYATNNGNSTSLVALGHPSILPVHRPEVCMITGTGINPQSAGEIWFHTDFNLGIPITMIENTKFRNIDLKRYNTIVLPEGNYGNWGEQEINKLKEWCQQGNILITIGTATDWIADKKIVSLSARKKGRNLTAKSTYENAYKESDAEVIGGSIFDTNADITHPLFYGAGNTHFSVMKTRNRFYDITSNKYATPSWYKDEFLISGYVPKGMESSIMGAAAITVHGIGNGKVICFQDNPLFRGYWVAGQKIFNNALFHSRNIDRRTIEFSE